ncbi:hypothetical protein SSX86_014432 [Deinandra increscens subsp. villosa]|uniref:Dof zinc finger protein n=1 Tax=Deinandra increscens subsp. villosa TaxID=3103831 RepID=A0AAP0H0C1_9ASTR
MIQELFGGAASGFLTSPSPSPSSSTTITTTTDAATTAANSTTSDTQKQLRCPRCDSSNTKFCYYNNYNLTQPRHFCKTCRRYWTKGGALRNVPIGGGCRKNKGTTTIATATGKLKAVVSSELGKSGNFINGFEHDQFGHNPVLWSAPPQTSHLLSLLRATQNPNPNFTPNIPVTTHMKDLISGSNMASSPSLGLWRNMNQVMNNHHEQQGFMRSSSNPANYYYHIHDQTTPLILGNNVGNNCTSSSTSTPTILDSAPVLSSGGELGFWNQTLPWSDLAAANGAYP